MAKKEIEEDNKFQLAFTPTNYIIPKECVGNVTVLKEGNPEPLHVNIQTKCSMPEDSATIAIATGTTTITETLASRSQTHQST